MAEGRHYDAVVVGSGFGGAVAGARLAEAGRSVCLLERGRWWAAAEYPRTLSQAEAAVWEDGRNYGFLEYRVFRRMDVIQGSAVGGGSLHYFNVQLRAPASIFDRPEWPGPYTGALMSRYYDRVHDVMDAAPLVPPAGEALPERTTAFLHAARTAGYSPELVPIGVHTGATRTHPVSGVVQQPCSYTADCLLGCRVHAKHSLDVNYLPLGERHGLEIRPLHEVTRIEPDAGGWRVTARALDPDKPGRWQPVRLRCRALVLAAGALGTNELLLRSRDVDRTLPGLPRSLGRGFSPNGDMLFAGTSGSDLPVDPSLGPSITAGAFVQKPGSPHVVHLQDLGYPPTFTALFDAALPTTSRLRSAAQAALSYVQAALGGSSFRAGSLFGGSAVPRFLPYLGMGTDAADGVFELDGDDRLALRWSPRASAAMFAEMEDAMRALSRAVGGRYVRSLPWRWPLRRLLTAHPLGGCSLSESPRRGVIDHRGQVWGHPGLYVADGAAIPGPLAVNPSHTIAAVAERVTYWMLHDREAE